MPVGAAVLGSTLIGAVASDRAADKAASATKKGIDATNQLALQARNDAINLFQGGQRSGIKGIQAAMDFYRNSANALYKPYIQGNVAAQDVIGQGAEQANNAILGLPVDMGFTQPRQITPDLSYLNNAALPAQEVILGAQPSQQQQGSLQPTISKAVSSFRGILGR